MSCCKGKLNFNRISNTVRDTDGGDSVIRRTAKSIHRLCGRLARSRGCIALCKQYICSEFFVCTARGHPQKNSALCSAGAGRWGRFQACAGQDTSTTTHAHTHTHTHTHTCARSRHHKDTSTTTHHRIALRVCVDSLRSKQLKLALDFSTGLEPRTAEVAALSVSDRYSCAGCALSPWQLQLRSPYLRRSFPGHPQTADREPSGLRLRPHFREPSGVPLKPSRIDAN